MWNASWQGVVTVSLMRKGGKSAIPYFDGTIADEKGMLRLYGFDSNVQRKLFQAAENSKGKGMMLRHCKVKQAKHRWNFEVSFIAT